MDQRHAGGQQASAVNLSIGRAQLALPAPPVEQKVEEPAAVQPASRIQAAVKEEGQPKAVDKKDEVQKSEDLEKQLDEAVETAGAMDKGKKLQLEVRTPLNEKSTSAGHRDGYEQKGSSSAAPQKTWPKPITVKESMARLREALDTRQAQKTSNGKTATLKRPAASTSSPAVLRKPSCVKPPAKRPVCAIVEKSESSKMPSSKKVDPVNGKLTKAQARKMRPHGCSKCREVPGCTRSCWINRKYEPLW